MFCKHCGKEINDNAVICPYCGIQVGYMVQGSNKSNTIAVVGFILSFFIPLIGLICSVIGKRNAQDCGYNGLGLAKAGIIISIIMMAIPILILMFWSSVQ